LPSDPDQFPPEWNLYQLCQFPAKRGRPPLTPDQVEGLHGPSAWAWQRIRLYAYTHYTWEQTGEFSPDLAQWFAEFAEKGL
jgi:hypothetical protein